MRVDAYRDGGTISIVENGKELYCVDNRIGSRTKGMVYAGYPTKADVVQGKKAIEEAEDMLTKAFDQTTFTAYKSTILRGLEWLAEEKANV